LTIGRHRAPVEIGVQLALVGAGPLFSPATAFVAILLEVFPRTHWAVQLVKSMVLRKWRVLEIKVVSLPVELFALS